MAVNIEIKARLADFRKMSQRVGALSDTPVERIEQEDTFFRSGKGRLKLRLFSPEEGELIYYERQDTKGPRPSNYHILQVADPAGLKALLISALGTEGVVRKMRWLYKVGQSRIHLDRVVGLGDFLEIEVVLFDGQDQAMGIQVAEELKGRLGIRDEDLVGEAYIDLLKQ